MSFGRAPRATGWAIAVGVLFAAMADPLDAQTPEYDSDGGLGRHLAGGGEITAILSPRDTTAFFNYSDYERNLLRITRIRLFGEWRTVTRLSVIGEIRTENTDQIMMPALYLRWQPRTSQELYIHAGRIPPVIGGFGRHAYGRDNIVLGQPLAYQYLTSLRPDAVPATVEDLLRMRGRGWQPSYPVGSTATDTGVPLVSASTWDTGVAGIWRHGRIDVSSAVTQGSPAVPLVRDTNDRLMWSGRVGAFVGGGVTVGVSAARGQWLEDAVLDLTPAGRHTPSAQSLVATDVEVGHGPFLVRGEWIRSVFEVPITTATDPNARLDVWSGFVEARYRPLPRWQVGVRLDRLAFGDAPGSFPGSSVPSWDADVDRVEAVLGFRAHRRIELRGGWQHNWREGGRVREQGFPVLAVLGWF
jgi:hypothetical protein